MTLDPKTWWYVTRATGFVAWGLLALSVLWGLFITNKTLHRSTPPSWVLDLHRHLGGLAVVFVAVHVLVLPLDGYTDWGWRDLAIPLHTEWHPVAVAWGVVATYLLLAVEITSLLQRRMPRRWWRRVHMLSFPLYVIASIHLFAAGTDAGNSVAQGVVIVVSSLIAFLTVVRLLAAAKPRETGTPRVPPRARAAAGAATAAVTQGPATPTASSASLPAATADLLPATTPVPSPPPVPADAVPAPARDRVFRARSVEERADRLQVQTRAAVRRAESSGPLVPSSPAGSDG